MNESRLLSMALIASLAAAAGPALAAGTDRQSIERGRYIVKIGGCNDCHTPGYAMKGGRVPEELWLTGDALGWRGPWGTTYPTNLRIHLSGMTEDAWVQRAATLTTRPPMPWFNVRDMSERDLRALYRYVRSLGVAGKPAPAYVPPGREPPGPAIVFPAGIQ